MLYFYFKFFISTLKKDLLIFLFSRSPETEFTVDQTFYNDCSVQPSQACTDYSGLIRRLKLTKPSGITSTAVPEKHYIGRGSKGSISEGPFEG